MGSILRCARAAARDGAQADIRRVQDVLQPRRDRQRHRPVGDLLQPALLSLSPAQPERQHRQIVCPRSAWMDSNSDTPATSPTDYRHGRPQRRKRGSGGVHACVERHCGPDASGALPHRRDTRRIGIEDRGLERHAPSCPIPTSDCFCPSRKSTNPSLRAASCSGRKTTSCTAAKIGIFRAEDVRVRSWVITMTICGNEQRRHADGI